MNSVRDQIDYSTFDEELVIRRIERGQKQPLLALMLFVVFLLHMLVLYFVEFGIPVQQTPTLRVILEKLAEPTDADFEEVNPNYELENSENDQENEREAEAAESFTEQPAHSFRSLIAPSSVTPKATERAGKIDYGRFSQIIREKLSRDGSEDSVKPKTFSTADFPDKSGPPSYYRQEVIQKLVTAPRKVIRRDASGYTTILTDDGFGNVICIQERGFTGDANPPLWYIIPAKTCGHLK